MSKTVKKTTEELPKYVRRLAGGTYEARKMIHGRTIRVSGKNLTEVMMEFVRENLFDINKIYADSEVDIACDITEINIFIAVMYLFGIKVYYGNTYVIPDQVYVGEIQKIIKRKLKEHPMCIAKASPEERAVVIDIILDIFDNLWLDYRKKM